jgi:hypothetical protein
MYMYIKLYILQIIEELALIYLNYLLMFRDGYDMDVQSMKDGCLFPWRT